MPGTPPERCAGPAQILQISIALYCRKEMARSGTPLGRRPSTNSTDLYSPLLSQNMARSAHPSGGGPAMFTLDIDAIILLRRQHLNCDREVTRRVVTVRLEIELARNPRNRVLRKVVDHAVGWYVTAHDQLNCQRISEGPVALDLQGTPTSCCFEIGSALLLRRNFRVDRCDEACKSWN